MTLILAHRGSSGTHPENTLPAFAEAVRTGADGIHLDVHLTKDQQLIIMHDETVDRTTDGKGLVRELTLEEIKKLDAGSWFAKKYKATKVSTLQEVLNLLLQMNFRGILNIELKTENYHYPGIEMAVSKCLHTQEWPFTHWYSSFNLETLRILHEIEPDAQLDLLLKKSRSQVAAAMECDFIEGIHPSYQWVQENSNQVANFPKAIRPWTPNLYQSMIQCFDLKLAAIITDFPEKAHRVKSRMRR
ncbi:glycerophosphodiester phosphodiesterase [Enterococcus florum]|uniref:Glycerophosphodiester phosphodiesterase n=1 Tax=Enterococcus florum TaxID=2480627 RepID=A0A4P5PFL3_9ENTE|nr:glycerophosphodiester phosphodiesterase [Enterococcus florum]GCF92263.1 glycerophosphodiester phosphodiesterase [Enterococcus florum]